LTTTDPRQDLRLWRRRGTCRYFNNQRETSEETGRAEEGPAVKVGDVMTTDLVTVTADTPLKEVAERLVRSEVSSLPVLDDHHRLIGIVTEADLISKEAYGGHRRRALALLADVLSGREHRWVTKAAGSVAADVMTTVVVTCRPNDDVRSAARRILERGVKRLPVVEADKLVGIVSRQDILRMFDRPDDVIRVDVERVLSGLNRPDDSHVRCSVQGGVVTLTGDVRYAWDKPIVVWMVREVEGVIDVISELHNREPNPRPSPRPWMPGPR
jgi:CBS domain-containing protein